MIETLYNIFIVEKSTSSITSSIEARLVCKFMWSQADQSFQNTKLSYSEWNEQLRQNHLRNDSLDSHFELEIRNFALAFSPKNDFTSLQKLK